MNAWASNSEIVKGRTDELPKPVHERGILLSGNHHQSPRVTINLPSNSSLNEQQKRAMAIDHLYHLIMQAASGQKGFSTLQIGPSDKKNYVLKTYHVPGAMIEYLKRKHFPMRRGFLPFSTFEALAAHLWKVSSFLHVFLPCVYLCVHYMDNI